MLELRLRLKAVHGGRSMGHTRALEFRHFGEALLQTFLVGHTFKVAKNLCRVNLLEVARRTGGWIKVMDITVTNGPMAGSFP